MASKLSSIQLEKASTSPALKLPHLFSLTPNSSGKGAYVQKRQAIAPQAVQIEEDLLEGKSLDRPLANGHVDNYTSGLHFYNWPVVHIINQLSEDSHKVLKVSHRQG